MRCDDARGQALAARESSSGSDALVEAHLATCSACRSFLEEDAALAASLGRLQWNADHDDLWPRIAPGLRRRSGASTRAIGALVVMLAIGEIAFQIDGGVVSRLVPPLAALAWFLWMRVNPFTLDPITLPPGARHA